MTLRSAWPRFSAALIATAAIYFSGGCSFFYDLNTTQCEVTADCLAFGSQFANTTCVNRVCVEKQPTETGGTSGTSGGKGGNGGTGTGGTSNGGTVTGGNDAGGTDGGGDAGGGGVSETGGSVGTGGTAGTGGTPPECTTNKQCIEANLDLPYICRNGKCVELITDDCPVIVPKDPTTQLAVLKDNTPPIIVGGFATMDNPGKRWETKAVINWNLAFGEFDTALGVGSRPRVLGLICQGYAPEMDLEASMAHLTQDVGVPAILSTLPADALAAAWDYTQTPEYIEARGDEPPEVFFMSTGSADLRLANLDDSGLVWHLLGDPRVLAATTTALVTRIIPRVQEMRQAFYDAASGREDPSTPLRVTLVTADDPTLIDISKVLTTYDSERPDIVLTFNGKPVYDATNMANFRQVEIQSVKVHQTVDTTNGSNELRDHPPHIIVAMATGEFPPMISGLEANWGKVGTPSEGVPRPFYVLSNGIYTVASALSAPMQVYAGTTPPLNFRTVGVNFAAAQDARSKALYDSYYLELKKSYPDMTLNVAGTENHYDGAYSLLYSAMAAAPFTQNKPSGVDIRDGWRQRVIAVGGTSVDIGYSKLAATINSLSSSGYKMALWATMGPPQFDFLSGTRTTSTSAWCSLLKAGSNPPVYEPQTDGLIYDLTTKKFIDPASGVVPTCLQQY
jgi:hypothetical protein